MSHHTIYKTQLTGITVGLLQEALQNLAKQIGAEVGNQVQDYYGNRTRVSIALKTKDLPMGIGFSVSREGSLRIEGDSYGCFDEFNGVGKIAENYLKAYMTIQKTRQLNPAARAETKILGRQVVVELAW